MIDYFALVSVLFVAMITPGPNNLAILQIASSSGLRRIMMPVTGIVLGGLIMFGACLLGVGVWIANTPAAGPWIAGLGSTYLIWLAYRLVFPPLKAPVGESRGNATPMSTSAIGLFVFQFLNPKAWVLVLTVAAIVPSATLSLVDIAVIALLFVIIPSLCLSAWAILGALMSRVLSNQPASRALDRFLGCILAFSVVLMWR